MVTSSRFWREAADARCSSSTVGLSAEHEAMQRQRPSDVRRISSGYSYELPQTLQPIRMVLRPLYVLIRDTGPFPGRGPVGRVARIDYESAAGERIAEAVPAKFDTQKF